MKAALGDILYIDTVSDPGRFLCQLEEIIHIDNRSPTRRRFIIPELFVSLA